MQIHQDTHDQQQEQAPPYDLPEDVALLTAQPDRGGADREVLRRDHLPQHAARRVGRRHEHLIDPGVLQVNAAKEAGLDQTLLAAANSSGGVLGKMVSPQNLAIGAAAVGLGGQEGELFRKVIGWSLLLLLIMCLLVYLQSTAVLSWMVV